MTKINLSSVLREVNPLICSLSNKTFISDIEYDRFRKYFMTWFLPSIILIGLVGNAVSLSVLAKFRVFQSTTSVLFSSLAVADIISLIFAAGYLWFGAVFNIELMNTNRFFCFLIPYLEAVGYWWSPWLQATLSFHRMLAVRFPFEVRTWLTLRRTRMMIFWVTMLVVLYAIIIPYKHTWNPLCQRCEKGSEEYTIYYSHGVFGSFIPFGIMLVSTVIISVMVCKSNITSKQCGSPELDSNFSRTSVRISGFSMALPTAGVRLIVESNGSGNGAPSPFRKHERKSRTSSIRMEKRVTLVLLSMNLTYVLTNGAAGVFLLLRVHLVEMSQFWIWHTLHRFFDVLACVNNSTNWIFYLMSGAQYRHKFLSAVRILKPSKSYEMGKIQANNTS